MPAYNAEKTIQASIDSVKAQTWADWELIIVNDDSRDATMQIAQAAADSDHRIRVEANKRNMGIAATRNAGISKAKGQWIAFLDSDDIWHKDKLDKQLGFIKANNAAICYTATAYISGEGALSSYVLQAKHRLSYKQLLRSNIMSCSSIIVCRDLMNRFPFTKGRLHEDYVTWLKMLQNVDYAYGLNEPLLLYRMTQNSNSGRRLSSALMVLYAYRAVGYGRVYSFLLTLRYAAHSIPKRVKVKKGWKGL